MLRKFGIAESLVLTALFLPHLSAQVTVLTAQYGNDRTGANVNERILSTSNTNQQSFGKLFSWPVDGRVYAQPLYVPNVTVGGNATNVVIVATEHNSIYAFDAKNSTTSPLWVTSLGPSVPAFSGTGRGCPVGGTGPELGILSTPVVDIATRTIYVVSSSPDPQFAGGYNFFINALDVQSGLPRADSPQQIRLSVPGQGYDNVGGVVALNNTTHIQRAALLLNKGAIYAGFGSCGPDVDPYHGWIAGYDARDLTRQTVAYTPTAGGQRGGIWMSGAGPVGDSKGYLYFTTGNGSNGRNLYSDGVVKLSGTGSVPNVFIPPNYADLSAKDLDLSSAGPILIPGTRNLIAGGKEGVIYLLNADNLRSPFQSFQATSGCGVPTSEHNCKRLHSLVYWPMSSSNGLLYVWGDNDNLRAYSYSSGVINSTPFVQGALVASAVMSLSANGDAPGTGILWAMTANTLRAFDALTLAELWNSDQNSARDSVSGASHWALPAVADGRVYLPTNQGQVLVYGLLSDVPPPVLSFSGSSWTFSAHPVGETSGNGQITVTNSGSSIVNFATILFTGANPGDFRILSNTCAAIASKASCKVAFNFTPTAPGARSANLTFVDDAPGSPQTIPIRGTGR